MELAAGTPHIVLTTPLPLYEKASVKVECVNGSGRIHSRQSLYDMALALRPIHCQHKYANVTMIASLRVRTQTAQTAQLTSMLSRSSLRRVRKAITTLLTHHGVLMIAHLADYESVLYFDDKSPSNDRGLPVLSLYTYLPDTCRFSYRT